MSQRSCFTALRYLAFVALALLLASAIPVPAKPPGGGGGGGDPPTLPNVRYLISVAPTPIGAFVLVNGMNNSGMAVGYHSEVGGANRTPFFFHAASGTYYAFAWETHLTDQVDLLSPGWVFQSAHAINNLASIVGTIKNPIDGVFRGYVIDTGGSLDVNDWTLALLPEHVSNGTNRFDINDAGDVLGHSPADGSDGLILYNPWTGEDNLLGVEPTGLGALMTLNNYRQIAVHLGNDTFRYIDASVSPPFVDTVTLPDLDTGGLALSDAGVVAGVQDYVQFGDSKSLHKNTYYDILFKYNGATGEIANVVVTSSSLFVGWGRQWLNASGDMAYQKDGNSGNGRVELWHAGFSGGSPQTWNIDDLIADSDPWRQDWIAATGGGFAVIGVSERSDQNDATGYPLLVAQMYDETGRKCAVLTPVDVPAP